MASNLFNTTTLFRQPLSSTDLKIVASSRNGRHRPFHFSRFCTHNCSRFLSFQRRLPLRREQIRITPVLAGNMEETERQMEGSLSRLVGGNNGSSRLKKGSMLCSLIDENINVEDGVAEIGFKKRRDWISMTDEEFKREAAFIAANPCIKKSTLLPPDEWVDFCVRRGQFIAKSLERVGSLCKDVDLSAILQRLRGRSKVSGQANTNFVRGCSKNAAIQQNEKDKSVEKLTQEGGRSRRSRTPKSKRRTSARGRKRDFGV